MKTRHTTRQTQQGGHAAPSTAAPATVATRLLRLSDDLNDTTHAARLLTLLERADTKDDITAVSLHAFAVVDQLDALRERLDAIRADLPAPDTVHTDARKAA